MQPTNHDETRRLIEEYNRRLMETYRQATPPPVSSAPSSTASTADTTWLDKEFPLPDIQRDKETMPATLPDDTVPRYPYTDEDLQGEVPRAEEQPASPATDESAYIGYMRVFVFTGQTAEPLEGATVTVTRPQGDRAELYATAITNADGFTPVLPLPSVSPALTMRPDIPHPYISYDIRVSVAGFRPVIYENVPVYGNNVVTQSAGLLPLIPGQDANDPLVIRSGAPTNL